MSNQFDFYNYDFLKEDNTGLNSSDVDIKKAIEELEKNKKEIKQYIINKKLCDGNIEENK